MSRNALHKTFRPGNRRVIENPSFIPLREERALNRTLFFSRGQYPLVGTLVSRRYYRTGFYYISYNVYRRKNIRYVGYIRVSTPATSIQISSSAILSLKMFDYHLSSNFYCATIYKAPNFRMRLKCDDASFKIGFRLDGKWSATDASVRCANASFDVWYGRRSSLFHNRSM